MFEYHNSYKWLGVLRIMAINLTQDLVYETDSLESFKKVLEVALRVMYKEESSEYSQLFLTERQDMSFNDGSRYLPNGKKTLPKYMHVFTIGDYKSNIQKEDEKFSSISELVDKVIRELENINSKKFTKKCGDGYNEWFNRDDGSVDVGYRLAHRPYGGWNELDISLCHIYYGK